MAEKTRRTGRLALEIIISLIALTMMISAVNRNQLKVDMQLIFEARSGRNDMFELDLDGQRLKARVEASKKFQDVVFKLPKRQIQKIRLHLGRQADSVSLRRITLKTLFKSYSWPVDSFGKIFNFKHHIRETVLESDRYRIMIGGKNPYLGISSTIPAIIQRLAGRNWLYYLLSFFSALLLFCFLRVLSFRNLRVFFRLRIAGNFVLIFLVAVCFPLVNSFFHLVKPLAIPERRQLAARPEFRFDAFPDFLSDYQRYYDDHFIWRNHFIKANNLISYTLFRKSATPLVTLGKKGWLFMAEETPVRDETAYFRSVDLFSITELENWARILEQRRSWLTSMGIEYLFLVVPNKSTIYPEFMPDHIRRLHAVSRLDQLLDYLRLHSKVRILDLRPSLLGSKNAYPVYYKTDSHWNDYGAYIAYREIILFLSEYYPDEKPMPLTDFEIHPLDRAGGDLAQALALEKSLLREDSVEMKPRIPPAAETVSRVNLSPYVTQSISRCRNGRLPGAVMVHDSFIHELRPFLAQHFSRLVFIWDWGLNVYPEIIRRERPWLVIEEMAERYLMDKILSNPDELEEF